MENITWALAAYRATLTALGHTEEILVRVVPGERGGNAEEGATEAWSSLCTSSLAHGGCLGYFPIAMTPWPRQPEESMMLGRGAGGREGEVENESI